MINETTTKSKKISREEYWFCLLVGSMYIYALNLVIMSSTFIRIAAPRLFAMGVASLVFFALIFYNRITRIVSAAVVAIGAFIIFFTFERWESQADHFYNVSLMVRGYLHYQPELGRTIVWAISLLLGLVVAVFMLYRFSFYLLSITGVAIFLFTWGPGFTRDPGSFLIFLICFCLLLIRKTNRSISAMRVATPICIGLVAFIQLSMPMEANLFQRRTLQELFDGPLAAVGDFIYILTNPMYFSFQSTGFSGQGGRLGGPVTPNNRNVMTVQAPGHTYLAGATHNTYTGYAWISTLEPGQLYTQGMHSSRFEMLETAVRLMRDASDISAQPTFPASRMWSMFPIEDHGHLSTSQFPALGLGLGLSNIDMGHVVIGSHNDYIHAYLPIDQATIAIGTNRTGTIFRPQNTRQVWFHPAGPDYLSSLIFDPSGDMRAPSFMARGTQYTMNFLNINRRLSFIDDMLNESFQGFHERQGARVYYLGMSHIHIESLRDFYEESLAQPDDMCEFTYITLVFYRDEYFIPRDDDPIYMDTFSLRIATGLPHIDAPVTAEDINNIFEMFASPGPNRELQYFDSFAHLMATLDIFSREVLATYAESVREHFMYVPEIVPQRVYDLVAEIISGLETDFEKIMAIRDYLIQFPYTLSPMPVPYGVCFVDHFLFEGQEGYCTYYASAMAIMSRIAGVPSRYVEGFLLPGAPADADGDVAIFVVTNRMAHAWVEVYLEGFGWLIVEATAPYAFFTDPVLPPPIGHFPPGTFPDEWWYYDWEYWQDLDNFDFFPGNPGMGPGGAGPGADVVAGGGREITMAQVRNITLVVLAVIIVVLLVFLIRQYVYVATMGKRIRRLPINQQISTYFTGILAIASHCTSAKDPAETPYVYGQRVGRRFAFKNDSARLRDLVTLYYRARYGSHQLTDDERAVMEESYFDMVNYLRLEHKRPHFLYLRYILRIGAI